MSDATLVSDPSLVHRLAQLIDDIARVRDGPPCPGRTGLPLLRWEDDDYIYLEIDCSGSAALEADISVWQGRVVIRVVQ